MRLSGVIAANATPESALPSPPSFRDGPKDQTRNLEILWCAIAHHSSRFRRAPEWLCDSRRTSAFSRRNESFKQPPSAEGAGKAGREAAPAAWRAKWRSTPASHHRYCRTTRPSPREGLTAYFVISPVNGLSCHRHLRVTTCKLDASVAAPGPHDFAVCGKRSRPARSKIAPDACHIHRIPRPTCRDDRDTPLSIGARDGRISKDVLPDGESEKFLPEGLDFWTSRKAREW